MTFYPNSDQPTDDTNLPLDTVRRRASRETFQAWRSNGLEPRNIDDVQTEPSRAVETSLRPVTGSVSTTQVKRSGESTAQRRKKKSSDLSGGVFFLATMAFSILVAWFVGPKLVEQYFYAAAIGRARGEYKTAVEHLDGSPLTEVSLAFQMVAQRIKPSVVSVKAFKTNEIGFGSGVILSTDGYIMSNAHVVKDASGFEIELYDRRKFAAELVGLDTESDLAVLKIDCEKLIPATWGDSEKIEVGSFVWAIGSPYEFTHTITSGILSGKNRRGDTNHSKQTLLQTDAAVNPGNSGGPLVDIRGHVIGINTSIYGESFRGISFAVPSANAKFVFEQLVTRQKVTRGFLGVDPRPVDAGIARRMNLPDLEGAIIVRVQNGSPADLAGLRPGDVLRRWDGVPIRDYRQVFRFAESTPVDSPARIDFWRLLSNGELIEESTEVIVSELSETNQSRPSEFFRQ